MINLRRYWKWAVLFILILGACSYTWRSWRLAHPDRSHTMTELTENMQTFCVGRLLIDLPAGTTYADAKASYVQLGSFSISTTIGISREQFDELLERRWKEVQAIKKDNYGDAYLQPSERIVTPEGGVIFAYEFEKIKGLAEDDETVVYTLFHRAEGYFWQNDTLFEIAPKLNSKDRMQVIFPRLYARTNDEIPSRPGLCLNGSFVDGYYDLSDQRQEEMSWRFDLPRNLRITIRHSKVSEPVETLFQRDKSSLAEARAYKIFLQDSKTYEEHLYRRAKRTVSSMSGEEGISGALEGSQKYGYSTHISGVWEFPGEGVPIPRPHISVNLSAPVYRTSHIPSPAGGFPDSQDITNGPTEAEFMEIWDAIIDSIRPRPDAFVQPPPGSAPLSPVGQGLSVPRVSHKPMEDDHALEEFLADLKPKDNWMDDL